MSLTNLPSSVVAAALAALTLSLFNACETESVTTRVSTRSLPSFEPRIAKADIQNVRTTAYTHTEADHTQFGAHNALGGELRAATPRDRRAELSPGIIMSLSSDVPLTMVSGYTASRQKLSDTDSDNEDGDAPKKAKPAEKSAKAPKAKKVSKADDDDEDAPKKAKTADKSVKPAKARKATSSDDADDDTPKKAKVTEKSEKTAKATKVTKAKKSDDEDDDTPKKAKVADKGEKTAKAKKATKASASADDDEDAPAKSKSAEKSLKAAKAKKVAKASAPDDEDDDSPKKAKTAEKSAKAAKVTKVTKTTITATKVTRAKKAVAVKKQTVIGSAAADWGRWPVGTTFRLVSTGQVYRIDDYGWALSGRNTIDLYMPNEREMNAWGTRQEAIEIMHWGDAEESKRLLAPHSQHKHIRRMLLELDGRDEEAAALR